VIRGRHPRRARDRLIIARAKSNVRSALRRDGIVDVIGEANFAPTVERASSPTRRPHAERATHLGAERVGWRTHSKRRGHPNSRDDGLVSGLASLVERGSGEARRSADRTS